MKTEIIEKENCVIVRVEGTIKSGMEFDFADAIDEAIRTNDKQALVIDLENVPFVNSACLGIILNYHKEYVKMNKMMYVYKPSAEVLNMFQVTNLDSLLLAINDYEDIGE